MGAEEEVRFILAHAQGWRIYVFVALAAFLGWVAWRRYGPRPEGIAGRVARVCRLLAVVLAVLLLTAPSWRLDSISTVPGKLLILVDSSASMQRDDAPGDRPRWEVARELHEALSARAREDALQVQWQSIDDGATALDPQQIFGDFDATGAQSAIGRSVEEAVYHHAPDAVVLVSDGRVTLGSSLDAAGRAISQRGALRGVWVLGVGSERIDPELHIDELQAPGEAALDEQIPVQVRLSARGLGEGPIEMVLRHGDRELDRVTIDPAGGEADGDDPLNLKNFAQNLSAVLDQEGQKRLQLEVRQGELSVRSTFVVDVTRRKLQVLLLAQRPRYELRYLREALKRDTTVTIHSYLMLDEGRWLRWGDETQGPDELPLMPNTLRDYDVVVIGDIPADALRAPHLQAIEQAVREHGMGLVWLPGESGNITGFRDGRLGKLLPVDMPDRASIVRGYLDNLPRRAYRTPIATKSNLLTLEDEQWAELPELRGACPVLRVVEGATVLLEDQDQQPLVVVRDVPPGRSLFLAIDDTWRWRRNAGDFYLHRYWSQLLRYVSAGRSSGGSRWRVQASPHRAVPGEAVQIAVRPNGAIEDPDTLPAAVVVRVINDAGQERLFKLQQPPGEHSFVQTIPAPASGTWLVELVEGLDPAGVSPGELLVLPPSDEVRDPRINRKGLEDIAKATGGRVFFTQDLIDEAPEQPEGAQRRSAAARLVDALPPLARQQEPRRLEAAWDSAWAFALLMALMCTEWTLRRRHRLP